MALLPQAYMQRPHQYHRGSHVCIIKYIFLKEAFQFLGRCDHKMTKSYIVLIDAFGVPITSNSTSPLGARHRCFHNLWSMLLSADAKKKRERERRIALLIAIPDIIEGSASSGLETSLRVRMLEFHRREPVEPEKSWQGEDDVTFELYRNIAV